MKHKLRHKWAKEWNINGGIGDTLLEMKVYMCKWSSMQIRDVLPDSNWLIWSEAGRKSILWCLSFQRGVGISTGARRRCSTGNITRLFNWIFLFMIPPSPLWIRGAAAPRTNGISQGNNGRKEGFITQCRLEKNTSSSAHCMLYSDGKPGGGEKRSWGHYKDYKENSAPVLGAARKIKKTL